MQKSFNMTSVGDEAAYSVEIEGRKFFLIGSEIQSPDDFKKQIAGRFGKNFSEAWKEAVKICRDHERGVLLSRRYFYDTVYKPRRDDLSEKWTKKYGR